MSIGMPAPNPVEADLLVTIFQVAGKEDAAKENHRTLGEVGGGDSAGRTPPFEGWYPETWIRAAHSEFNVHCPYKQRRDFLSSQGSRR